MKMKKYLITGALALVACATLTSCHSDDELSGSLIEQKLQTYEQVFKQEFGEVNPNQDWGFGTADLLARTRTAMDRTRGFNDWVETLTSKSGENKNLNQWGDPECFNLQVPPALTDGQKERVRKYFQTHTPLTYVDPHYTNFYVQQVYKGGTSPANNPIMGNLTTEKYVMANANVNNGVYDLTTGSEHMDFLTVGLDANGNCLHHINDFNNGEWNLGQPKQVLNEGASTNNYQEGYQTEYNHPDQITLMLNSNTQKVGYANSTGSIQHNYACALVDPKVIDDWANTYYQETGVLIGENVYYNILNADGTVKINNQKWNRSFVGLDFEGNDPYLYDNNGNKVPAKVGDVSNSVQLAKYGNNYYIFDDIKNQTLKQLFNLTSEVYNLYNDMSQYAGTPSHLSGQSALLATGDARSKSVIQAGLKANGYKEEDFARIKDFNSEMDVLDLDVIKGKIDAGCCPVVGTGLVKWIDDFENRGRDYIYSDWIVTLTKAVEQGHESSTITIPIEPGNESSYEKRTYKQLRYITKFNQNGRIMCEDLGTSSISDIDFNDIVFDAWMYNMVPQIRTKIVKVENGKVTETIKDYSENDDDWVDAPSEYSDLIYTITDIYLLAGGGTIPANVAGVSLKNAFGTDNKYLVNTVDERDPQNIKRYGNPYSKIKWKQPAELRGIKGLKSFNDIDVVVEYNNSPVPLKSEPGKVPHKICVPIETRWPYERIVINEAYDFNDYVKNGSTVQYVGENAKPIYNSNRQIIGFYLDEMNRGDENKEDENKNIWKKTPSSSQEGNRYIDTELNITGIPYRDSARLIDSATDPIDLEGYEVETVSGGSSSGYKGDNIDPVLIRVRH